MPHKNNFKNTHSLKTSGKEVKSDAYKTVNERNHICKTKCSTFDFFKKTSTIKETVKFSKFIWEAFTRIISNEELQPMMIIATTKYQSFFQGSI